MRVGAADAQPLGGMGLLQALLRRIPDPGLGYTDAMVLIHVVLHQPAVIPSQPGDILGFTEDIAPADADRIPMTGYFRNVGIRTRAGELRQALTDFVDDGQIDWDETTWSATNPNRLKFSIRRLVKMPEMEGVWYRSAKVYYGSEEGNAA